MTVTELHYEQHNSVNVNLIRIILAISLVTGAKTSNLFNITQAILRDHMMMMIITIGSHEII